MNSLFVRIIRHSRQIHDARNFFNGIILNVHQEHEKHNLILTKAASYLILIWVKMEVEETSFVTKNRILNDKGGFQSRGSQSILENMIKYICLGGQSD